AAPLADRVDAGGVLDAGDGAADLGVGPGLRLHVVLGQRTAGQAAEALDLAQHHDADAGHELHGPAALAEHLGEPVAHVVAEVGEDVGGAAGRGDALGVDRGLPGRVLGEDADAQAPGVGADL